MLSAVPLPLGSSIKFVVSGPSGIGSLNCVLFRFLERLERRITAGIGSEALRVGNLKSLKKTAFQGEAKLEAVEREKENGPAVASYGKCPGRQYPGPGDEPPLGGGASTVGAHILDRWRTAWNRRLVSFDLFTRPDNRIRGTGIEGCHYRRLARLGPRLAPRESGRMTASFLVPGSDASHCNGFAETLYLMIKHVRSPLPSPPLPSPLPRKRHRKCACLIPVSFAQDGLRACISSLEHFRSPHSRRCCRRRTSPQAPRVWKRI